MPQKTYMPRSRRFLQATAVAALTLAATALAGPGAQAATSPAASAGGTTFTIPAGVTRVSATFHGVHFSVTKSAAQVAQTVSCYATASNPFRYYGGTYGGGVEGLSHVFCSTVVYAIQTDVYLFRNGVQVASNYSVVYSSTSGAADTEVPYSSGTYVTGADGYYAPTYGGSTYTVPFTNSASVYIP